MWSKSHLICANKDAKENLTKQRKKHILYLILDFLQDEGLFKSADSLVAEAQIYDDYKVCDNVNLDIILQEYSNYFQLKFNRQPSICKKVEKDSKILVKPNKSCETKIQKSAQKCEDSPSNAEMMANSIIISKITPEDVQIRETIKNNPISQFFTTVPADFKEWVENIYKEAKVQRQDVRWEDVKGLENAKQVLQESSTYPLKHPEYFEGLSAPWKSILLYGPPGGGKTLLAKALAYESKRLFFNVSPSVILSKWRGDSEKNIKILFDLARFNSPAIIFFDELEALTSTRDTSYEHEASRRMKSEILSELDGLNGNSNNILFLGTSNLPWDIDDALLRRMEKRIYIPLPNYDTRLEIFLSKLNGITNDITASELKLLAKNTNGYSGSDIHIVCREAAMASVRRLLNCKNENSKISTKRILQEDMIAAIAKVKPATRNHTSKYEEWSLKNGAE